MGHELKPLGQRIAVHGAAQPATEPLVLLLDPRGPSANRSLHLVAAVPATLPALPISTVVAIRDLVIVGVPWPANNGIVSSRPPDV